MDNNFIFVLIGVGILWFLHLILKELKIMRTLSELPPKTKESYDKWLNELDDKIATTSITQTISPREQEGVLEIELRKLERKRDEILESRRKHFNKINKGN
jgi:hypothetical protein